MFYCYVLRSGKTGRRYVGSCENLADRIRRHNAGESKATKHGLPWALIQSEAFATRTEAAQRCPRIAASVAVLAAASAGIPKKTGVWHKRLYNVIVEIPLFP
ncbi:MAG: GIY-YIG nuclease family protein, partial [Limisphaerales bacterium]